MGKKETFKAIAPGITGIYVGDTLKHKVVVKWVYPRHVETYVDGKKIEDDKEARRWRLRIGWL